MSEPADGASKPRLVGVNHVALEVGDLDAAMAFYGAIFTFTLRGRAEGMAFLDMGDQFLALVETATASARPADFRPEGHFGLVVDDRSGAKILAKAAGARLIEGGFLDFLDPWGNRIEIVEYADVQFTKAPAVLAGMGLSLGKTEEARRQLVDKGMLLGIDR
jgi:catechol 2,3-dioxygenase-like lactoylglutathione lyase family enzyme